MAALAPALLAARRIVEGRFRWSGLVLPDRHPEAAELTAFLESFGMKFIKPA